MGDAELKELIASLVLAQKETDRQIKKTDRQIKELGKQIGGLGEKFGSFTEGMAFPSLSKVMEEQFHMNVIAPNVRAKKDGEHFEIDVMAYANTDVNKVYLIEVKSHLREEGIEQLLKSLKRFSKFFPEHRDKKVYGVLAVVDASPELKKRTLDEGLYLAMIHDDLFEITVPKNFHPKAFISQV